MYNNVTTIKMKTVHMSYHVITVSDGNYPYVLSLFQMKKMSICITYYGRFKCSRPYKYNHACYHSVKLNMFKYVKRYESRHEISNNVVCATSKGSDQPAHTRSLIRAVDGRLNIL